MDYTNKSIEKAFRVFELFDRETAALSATEIARALGTTPSVIYPILRTLEKHGYLLRDDHKQYGLGYRFLERANLVLQKTDLYAHAKPHLRTLATTRSVNAHLGVLYASNVLYLHRELGSDRVVISEVTGLREPAYCTALGKTLLAFLPEPEFESYLSTEHFEAFTQHTIVDPSELRFERERIREAGYATSDEEAHEGIIGLGAPVRDFRGEVRAAISISIPKSRWDEESADLVAAVKQTAFRLSEKLGDVGREAAKVHPKQRIPARRTRFSASR